MFRCFKCHSRSRENAQEMERQRSKKFTPMHQPVLHVAAARPQKPALELEERQKATSKPAAASQADFSQQISSGSSASLSSSSLSSIPSCRSSVSASSLSLKLESSSSLSAISEQISKHSASARTISRRGRRPSLINFQLGIPAYLSDADERNSVKQYRVIHSINGEADVIGKQLHVALSVSDNRHYVLKVYTTSTSPGALERIQEEISILQSLKHDNIIQLHEVIDDYSRDKICLVMDYVSGAGNLCQGRSLSLSQIRRYFSQLLSAVGYLHSMGIVHLNLSYENLLLDSNGRLKIVGFGKAKRLRSQSDADDDRSVDVWACGIILYTLVKGPSRGGVPMGPAPEFDVSTIEDGRLRDLISQLFSVKDSSQYSLQLNEVLRHPWIHNDPCVSSSALPHQCPVNNDDLCHDALSFISDTTPSSSSSFAIREDESSSSGYSGSSTSLLSNSSSSSSSSDGAPPPARSFHSSSSAHNNDCAKSAMSMELSVSRSGSSMIHRREASRVRSRRSSVFDLSDKVEAIVQPLPVLRKPSPKPAQNSLYSLNAPISSESMEVEDVLNDFGT